VILPIRYTSTTTRYIRCFVLRETAANPFKMAVPLRYSLLYYSFSVLALLLGATLLRTSMGLNRATVVRLYSYLEACSRRF